MPRYSVVFPRWMTAAAWLTWTIILVTATLMFLFQQRSKSVDEQVSERAGVVTEALRIENRQLINHCQELDARIRELEAENAELRRR